MRIPAIRAVRMNARVPVVASARVDAAVGLNKFGLFSATLGALTCGSSQDGTLELTLLGRQLSTREEDEKLWEGVQLGVCGFTSADFRSCLDQVKQELRGAGLPLGNLNMMMFRHAIIGLPKSNEVLIPIKRDLRDALINAGLGVDCSVHVASETFDLFAFKSEERVWDVYSAYGAELQLERTETYNTPELREHYKHELDRIASEAKVEIAICREIEEEVSPCGSMGKRKKRCRDEGTLTIAKSVRLEHGRRSTNLIELLERVASECGQKMGARQR
ncbi:unnamed protein product [Phytophthora fragariaefolia]|uniref:Unnamed protein product n=1 Tax=Phytophthora fragariaefolia TaxID=1490495 RepID=A0A9W6XCK2_9STRA|nr:unnamed protein product [Phytophthora fragariaefolia]